MFLYVLLLLTEHKVSVYLGGIDVFVSIIFIY